jgi:malate dehydrogenase (oxaloacetate-decarboxylating)(NADP+)
MTAPIRRYEVDLLDDPVLPVAKRGKALLCDPLLNKGTGFPDNERDALGIRGLVPPQVVSIDDQVQRVMGNYRRKENDLERYIHLETLHDRNETLYFRVLMQHIRELTPIVYTPVVGRACQQFGHIYRRARGMYFASCELEYFPRMVDNWPEPEVDVVVVTDGSRILGLGDLGANGMGIPIGKLSLYVAAAGIYPCKTLPVMLDLGTDNAALREDILYLGERHPRLQNEAYYAAVEAFVQAVHGRWPEALIQFEDFSKQHAFPLLERYRDRLPCFNDDIQGTGAVALAGILSALRVCGRNLGDERVLFFGAGSAARGIADMIAAAMVAQEGLQPAQARSHIALVDSGGLVTRSRIDSLAAHKRAYALDAPGSTDLIQIVRQLRPTILIGVSGQPGAFTEATVREMRRYVERPILFPLSNPTSKAECTAEQAYRWSGGSALFASGSPFPPVQLGTQRFVPGQCNNMYIFPGLGMGAVTCRAGRITDDMFYAAALSLARQVGNDSLALGRLYPDLGSIRDISAQIAQDVAQVAFVQGLAGIPEPENLLGYVKARQFQPRYVPYRAV